MHVTLLLSFLFLIFFHFSINSQLTITCLIFLCIFLFLILLYFRVKSFSKTLKTDFQKWSKLILSRHFLKVYAQVSFGGVVLSRKCCRDDDTRKQTRQKQHARLSEGWSERGDSSVFSSESKEPRSVLNSAAPLVKPKVNMALLSWSEREQTQVSDTFLLLHLNETFGRLILGSNRDANAPAFWNFQYKENKVLLPDGSWCNPIFWCEIEMSLTVKNVRLKDFLLFF